MNPDDDMMLGVNDLESASNGDGLGGGGAGPPRSLLSPAPSACSATSHKSTAQSLRKRDADPLATTQMSSDEVVDQRSRLALIMKEKQKKQKCASPTVGGASPTGASPNGPSPNARTGFSNSNASDKKPHKDGLCIWGFVTHVGEKMQGKSQYSKPSWQVHMIPYARGEKPGREASGYALAKVKTPREFQQGAASCKAMGDVFQPLLDVCAFSPKAAVPIMIEFDKKDFKTPPGVGDKVKVDSLLLMLTTKGGENKVVYRGVSCENDANPAFYCEKTGKPLVMSGKESNYWTRYIASPHTNIAIVEEAKGAPCEMWSKRISTIHKSTAQLSADFATTMVGGPRALGRWAAHSVDKDLEPLIHTANERTVAFATAVKKILTDTFLTDTNAQRDDLAGQFKGYMFALKHDDTGVWPIKKAWAKREIAAIDTFLNDVLDCQSTDDAGTINFAATPYLPPTTADNMRLANVPDSKRKDPVLITNCPMPPSQAAAGCPLLLLDAMRGAFDPCQAKRLAANKLVTGNIVDWQIGRAMQPPGADLSTFVHFQKFAANVSVTFNMMNARNTVATVASDVEQYERFIEANKCAPLEKSDGEDLLASFPLSINFSYAWTGATTHTNFVPLAKYMIYWLHRIEFHIGALLPSREDGADPLDGACTSVKITQGDVSIQMNVGKFIADAHNSVPREFVQNVAGGAATCNLTADIEEKFSAAAQALVANDFRPTYSLEQDYGSSFRYAIDAINPKDLDKPAMERMADRSRFAQEGFFNVLETPGYVDGKGVVSFDELDKISSAKGCKTMYKVVLLGSTKRVPAAGAEVEANNTTGPYPLSDDLVPAHFKEPVDGDVKPEDRSCVTANGVIDEQVGETNVLAHIRAAGYASDGNPPTSDQIRQFFKDGMGAIYAVQVDGNFATRITQDYMTPYSLFE